MIRGLKLLLVNALAPLVIGIAAAPSAQAQQGTPEQCASIAADDERLACYDALFRDVTGNTGESSDVALESERLIPARPTGRQPATMTIACVDGELDVTFRFAGQLVSNTGDIAPMTYQVDSNATLVRTLRADADNVALSFGSPQDTRTFLDNLEGGTNLKVRMTPVRQRSLTVDFRIDQVAEDIAALRSTCG